jgi:hypothetical protein
MHAAIVALNGARGFSLADVYVTTDGSTPSAVNFQYVAIGTSSEFITVQPTDPTYCASVMCRINVGVFGFTAASYGLVISMPDAFMTSLMNGMPALDLLLANTTHTYKFSAVDSSNPVVIQTTAVTDNVYEWELGERHSLPSIVHSRATLAHSSSPSLPPPPRPPPLSRTVSALCRDLRQLGPSREQVQRHVEQCGRQQCPLFQRCDPPL